MFDREKVQRMTTELEIFVREYDEIYLIPEILTGELIALFRRLKMNIRAIVSDEKDNITVSTSFTNNSLYKDFIKLPVMNTAAASTKFNERTGIITVVKKPLPIIQTELTFVVNNRPLKVSTFLLSPDEILAIYARLIIFDISARFNEDGLVKRCNVQDIATKVVRGLNTFLESYSSNISLRFPDRLANNFKYEFDDAAIVIQGPIVYENNYTAETIKFYRSIYPNAPIVVSTWTGEATDVFKEECSQNSVVLLENVPPEFPGLWNINMQLESSLQGVRFVRENTAANFVLKCRTDQRINKPDFLTWFKNLILTFLPFGDKLRGRILLLDASKKLPFRTSDFFSFGYVEDIFKLYDIPRHYGENDELAQRTNYFYRWVSIRRSINKACNIQNRIPDLSNKKIRKFNRIMSRIAEVEACILRRFYNKYIDTIDRNKILETSWSFMRDYLLIVDVWSISLDWPKYEHDGAYNMSVISSLTNEIGFSRWLDLYRNFNADWV